jgi:hypothetical protein
MRLLLTWPLVGVLCSWSVLAEAQLYLLPDQEPQAVFADDDLNIPVVFHNPTETNCEQDFHARILQASSSTTVLISEKAWKRLLVPANETILESARLKFPDVKAETKFLVQWIVDSNQVVGLTEVLVYPTNLFHELKSLLGEETLGVLDPNDELKPLLQQAGVGFLDMGEMALEDFTGKLAIVGPFHPKDQMRKGLAQAIQRIARKGTPVVWLQPPSGPKTEIKPSFYTVPEGRGAVVLVGPELAADLSNNPKSQLNLIYFCKLALNPVPLQLPNLSHQP